MSHRGPSGVLLSLLLLDALIAITATSSEITIQEIPAPPALPSQPTATAAVTAGNPYCWVGRFQYETCCLTEIYGASGNFDCWHGDVYTFDRCCLKTAPTTVAENEDLIKELRTGGPVNPARGNPVCFDSTFTFEDCCDVARHGVGGRADCWSGGFTYAACCGFLHGGRLSQQQGGTPEFYPGATLSRGYFMGRSEPLQGSKASLGTSGGGASQVSSTSVESAAALVERFAEYIENLIKCFVLCCLCQAGGGGGDNEADDTAGAADDPGVAADDMDGD